MTEHPGQPPGRHPGQFGPATTLTELRPPSELRPLTTEEFAWIKAFLLERTGIELKAGKEAMVCGRLDRRLRHHGITSYLQFISLLRDGRNPAEERVVVDLLTTNETYFFRESAHFDLLPALIAARRDQSGPVRVWSAASSTGEEAYTIAMVLAANLGRHPWEVIGTDISTRVLDTARRGLYPLDAADKIPQELLKRYCRRGRDEYDGYLAVAPEVRANVHFRQANLIGRLPDLGRFDVVFLRNVMIYFGMETKRQVVETVAGVLRPGGVLILSHTETLSGLTTRMQLVTPSVYRLPAGAR